MTMDVKKPCRYCDGEMVLVQDRLYHDWTHECKKCGYFIELMPRSNVRLNHSHALDSSMEVNPYE